MVTPDTILRWYRELIARKYDGSARRRTGRPTVAIDLERPVVRMATENPTWGYTQLVGALDNLGHQVGRNTVKRVLRRHGLEPAPAQTTCTNCSKFDLASTSATIIPQGCTMLEVPNAT